MKRFLARLNGIKKSRHYHHSTFLHTLVSEILSDYNSLLQCKEDFWKTKARMNWLKERDAITRFYDTTTSKRRIRDRITSFKYDIGKPLLDSESIVKHIIASTLTSTLLSLSILDLPYADVMETYLVIFRGAF